MVIWKQSMAFARQSMAFASKPFARQIMKYVKSSILRFAPFLHFTPLKFSIKKPVIMGSAAMILSVLFAPSIFAQTYFIRDAKLLMPSVSGGGNIGQARQGDVIIVNGHVSQIGPNLTQPPGAQQISGDDLWVTPGIFAPLTNLGLVEISAEDSANDSTSKDSPTSIAELAVDSFNPKSPVIAINRLSGITHAAIINRPSHNLFSGIGLTANLSGDFDSVLNPHSFIYVQLGSTGADLAGGSRSAALSQLRAALKDAGAYPARYKGPDDGDALSRQDAAALARAARGFMPLIIGADRASDILRIIDLKQSHGDLDIIIAGAAEGWMVADKLAAANMKVMIDPIDNLPQTFDRVGARLDNAALLHKAGVDMAFYTRSSGLSHNVRVLRQFAGNAAANGLPWDAAFKAITTVPARWFNIESSERSVRNSNMIGGSEESAIEESAIEESAVENIVTSKETTNLVVWNGDPLEVTTLPLFIMIDGQAQPLISRQTELRDRYNPTREETKPYKYR